MHILWLTWKDRAHPLAGGAEVLNEALAERLARDGHSVRFIVGGFKSCASTITKDGYTITRVGGRFSVYWKTYRYYAKHLRGWADLVIDEVNTVPFFARWYCREPVILFVHQLAREIWFYELPLPFSLIGYLAEPIYLWMLRRANVLTVSESTRKDLLRFGFKKENIKIISEGIEMEPLADLSTVKKKERPTILALGSIRAMKRTHHIIRAFEIAKRTLPELQLFVAGDAVGRYGKRVLRMMERSSFAKDIRYFGHVDPAQKLDLLRRAHLLCVTSVKEGWGLTVTEANSQGTPAVVYDVDGLKESAKANLICKKNAAEEMANSLTFLLTQPTEYETLRSNVWGQRKEITFERAYADFLEVL